MVDVKFVLVWGWPCTETEYVQFMCSISSGNTWSLLWGRLISGIVSKRQHTNVLGTFESQAVLLFLQLFCAANPDQGISEGHGCSK